MAVAQDVETEGKDGDENLESELGIEKAEWWDLKWTFRRKILFEGGGLLDIRGGLLLFRNPDPLLLYNTGRCRRDMADLRAVTWDGNVLPTGVANFGADDGSAVLWVKPGTRISSTEFSIYLYYGNPDAGDPAGRLPEDRPLELSPGIQVRPLPEETATGKPPEEKSTVSDFFRDKLFLEAEDLLDPDGQRTFAGKCRHADEGASAGACLRLPASSDAASPVLQTVVELASGGLWQIHTRYRRQRTPTPFSLRINDAPIRFGAAPAPKEGYGWETHALDLPAGKHRIELRADPGAAPSVDCLLLTPDKAYIPDYRDFNGPVWMRFRVKNKDAPPHHIDFFNWNVTYSQNGMQGQTSCWLFKDQVTEIPKLAKELAARPANLIPNGDWTPWGKALPAGSWTWFCEIRFMGVEKNLDVEYQFATRPDPSRAFRAGMENTGLVRNLYVHMPASIHWDHVRTMTLTFGEWGRQRFEMAKSLGFKEGEGPKTIVAGTMASARSFEEARYIFKTCSWLGLNMIDVSLDGAYGSDVLEPLFEESGIRWVWDHAWVYGKGSGAGVAFDPKKTYRENTNLDLAAQGDSYYRSIIENYKKRQEARTRRIRFNIMGDEIGSFTSFDVINATPAQHGFYVEYLKEHGLSPDFFGCEKWDDVRAFGYAAPLTPEQEKKRKTQDAEKATTTEIQKAAQVLGKEDVPAGEEERTADDMDKEVRKAQEDEARRAAEKLAKPDPLAQDVYRNRAWYWTQKFRSHYTALTLHHYSAGMHRYFPEGMSGGPNLQAMPVQVGRMWDGDVNIFDLGRENAVDTLQVEDWWGSPHNVAFGMNLMRAAARKRHQQLAALLVGGGPGPRIMANLMEGCRFFLFYLYGPIYCIGPVWAEDPQTYRQIGDNMRQIARCEPDILAASPRPRDAALLVANTSEIHATFFAYPFDRLRISIYAALKDSQVPVDVIGEEEILEDGALQQYRILYVSDPHVDSRAQEKIKEWVRNGGTLWADYAGLARKEYDERSTILDEVFGLEDRGAIQPFSVGGRGWGCYGGISVPEGPGLKIPQGDVFDGETIPGLHTSAGIRGLYYKPSYKLSTGQALARFDDGSPAIVRNRYGKGQAFLFGFQAGFAYAGCYGNWTHALPFREPSTALRAQLMSRPARAAGVRPHLSIDRHFVQTAVHDGPAQTVVYINNLGPKMDGQAVRVELLREPASAYSSRGRDVRFQYAAPSATFAVDIPAWEGEIIVFRYKD